jgi:hypothetical protein
MIRLLDSEWERIRCHFPEEHIPDGRAGRKPVPTRQVLEAVLWILNTGAQGHMLPQCYPNHKTVHRRFQTWCRNEILRKVLMDIANELRDRGARNEEECFIDATFAMAKGGGAEIGATKRGKGLKIMAIVDRHGFRLAPPPPKPRTSDGAGGAGPRECLWRSRSGASDALFPAEVQFFRSNFPASLGRSLGQRHGSLAHFSESLIFKPLRVPKNLTTDSSKLSRQTYTDAKLGTLGLYYFGCCLALMALLFVGGVVPWKCELRGTRALKLTSRMAKRNLSLFTHVRDGDKNAHRDHGNRLHEIEREANARHHVRLFQQQMDRTLANPRNEYRDC